VRGTPAFIAPEQALGGADVDGRADIYATGCVAYWLITGQLVFTGETPMALLLQHANTPPIPASVRTELPVPPGLDEVILSCLEKDPTRRPQSARALSRRLDAIRDAGEWTQDDAREWWQAETRRRSLIESVQTSKTCRPGQTSDRPPGYNRTSALANRVHVRLRIACPPHRPRAAAPSIARLDGRGEPRLPSVSGGHSSGGAPAVPVEPHRVGGDAAI
jgi:serine/threonine protein kinase